MRSLPLFLIGFMFLLPSLSAQVITEGGNVTEVNLNVTEFPTSRWAGIVGWMNHSATPNPDLSIYDINIPSSGIYTAWPDGNYYDMPLIVTRLSVKPDPAYFQTPVLSDFLEYGMFWNFTVFNGWSFSIADSPNATLCNPCTYTTCEILYFSIPCVYINLAQDFQMKVLKFSNGTDVEPIFICNISNGTGYNGTVYEFEYLVPAKEIYSFYIYPQECNITVYIDGVQTTVFPNTANVYDLRAVVRHRNLSIAQNATVYLVEENGRNILLPILGLGKEYEEVSAMKTNSTGEVRYAAAPTRYNIPDSYGYRIYLLSLDPYCIQNLSIADYSSISPRYRSSLIDNSYSSQVKSSVQNMNALASTTTKWITQQKTKEHYINATTSGYANTSTLKVGAPNKINITLRDGGNIVEGELRISDSDGYIIVAPLQPEKIFYSNNATFSTYEEFTIIPTRYNNNANFTIKVFYNYMNVANVTFTYDELLEDPQPSDPTMDPATHSAFSAGIQNINIVLINMGRSISTVP
ncbi:MAG: hypothetical protein QXY05_00485 [Candidatus Anstonellales archaeon]